MYSNQRHNDFSTHHKLWHRGPVTWQCSHWLKREQLPSLAGWLLLRGVRCCDVGCSGVSPSDKTPGVGVTVRSAMMVEHAL